jgi:hypothetical protein
MHSVQWYACYCATLLVPNKATRMLPHVVVHSNATVYIQSVYCHTVSYGRANLRVVHSSNAAHAALVALIQSH